MSYVFEPAGEEPKHTQMRQRAQDRCSRLMDAKSRTTGVDVESLDALVSQHKEAAADEKAAGIAERDNNAAVHKILAQAEYEDAVRKQQEEAKLVNDWHYQKNSANRAEADLNPKLTKTMPIDPDACGPSAVQNFKGEDRHMAERVRLQKAEIKAYCMVAINSKEEKKANMREMGRIERERMQDIDAIRGAAQLADDKEKQDQKYEIMEYNRLLAKEKRLREKMEKERDMQLNDWELNNNYQDPLLAEDPMQAASMFGPTRVRRDHWKGMSSEEVATYYASNQEQQEELQAKREAEKAEDMQWRDTYDALDKQITAQEQLEAQGAMNAKYAAVADLKYQQNEHKLKEKKIKEASSFKPDDEFFKGFGTSSR